LQDATAPYIYFLTAAVVVAVVEAKIDGKWRKGE
jgi:hypothetical protein